MPGINQLYLQKLTLGARESEDEVPQAFVITRNGGEGNYEKKPWEDELEPSGHCRIIVLPSLRAVTFP